MNDPLNINIPLVNVETSLPLLPEGDYSVQCVESSIDPNKDKTGFNWNLKLATTSLYTAVDQREVKPNFPVYHICALQPASESKDVEAFKRSIGETVDALFGTSKENRPDFTRELVSSAVGRTCTAHVYIDNWKGQDKNKVKRLKKVVAA